MFITKLGQPTSRLSAGKSLINSNLESQLEKGGASTPWERLQTAVSGVLPYNPRLQTDSIIHLGGKMQLWFYFNLFYNAVCFTF